MKPKLLYLIALVICANTSFAQNPLFRYIPEGTETVVSFNLPRLAMKLSGESFRQSFFYRELMKKRGNPVSSLLDDPASTGIDLGTELMMTTSVDTSHGQVNKTVYVFGRISDPSKFEALTKKLFTTDKVSTFGTDKIVTTEKSGAFAWNNQVFVMRTSGDRYSWLSEMPSDTTPGEFEKWMKKNQEIQEKNAREAIFSFLAPKGTNSYASMRSLTDAFSQPADIRIWTTGKSASPMPPQLAVFGNMLNEMRTFMGSARTSIINFENGKIVSNNSMFFSGEMAEMYQKFPPPPADISWLSRLPQGNLLGWMSSSYNQQMAKEMLAKPMFKEFMDSLQARIPFAMGKISGLFKDQMVLAVLTPEKGEQMPQVVLGLKLQDRQAFFDFSKNFMSFYDSLMKEKEPSKFLGKLKPVVRYDNEWAVMSFSDETAKQFLAGGTGRTIPEDVKAMGSYPVLMQMDLNSILDMAFAKMPEERAQDSKEAKEMVLSTFDKVVMYGGKYENGQMNSTIEMRFKNQEKNSLKQFFEFFNGMIESVSKVTHHEDESDTIVAPVIQEGVKDVRIDVSSDETKVPPPPPPPKYTAPRVETKKAPVKKKDN